MPNLYSNRLTVLGSKTQVQRFQKSHWDRHLAARHGELLEDSPGRFACQFETESTSLERLRRLSRRWPNLVLLLIFESEEKRIMGLVKAKAGKLEHWQTSY
jgi:hypothetical protein